MAQIGDAGFVEVSGEAIFNDMNLIKSTLEKFNQIGEALAYVGNFENVEKTRQQFEKLIETTKDKNEKARLKHRLKNLENIKNLAKDHGLQQDAKFLEHLAFVLDYGFQDQFIVQIPIGQYTFSSDCKRDDFRENEHLLVRKYSRIAEKEFVLVGTVTQSSGKSVDYEDVNYENSEPKHLKEVIMNIVEALSVVEFQFSGKIENEIIIDPIAIYREI